MKTHIVKCICEDGTQDTLKVSAYNVFHAEKQAKKRIRPNNYDYIHFNIIEQNCEKKE